MVKLVMVRWNDAEDFKASTWASNVEAEEFTDQDCAIESVGWLVRETSKYVTIASDFSADPDTWGRITKIPKGMVVSITPIEVPSS